MSTNHPIKALIDDAKFLRSSGRPTAALIILLTAIDASSKKLFPDKNQQSLDEPIRNGRKNLMGNRERFVRFLGPRIRSLIFKDAAVQQDGRHSRLIRLNAETEDPEVHLYKAFRNNLIHEGTLPTNEDFTFEPQDGQIRFEFSGHDGRISYRGLLDILEAAVVGAPSNGKEFGIPHYRMVPKDPLTNLAGTLSQKYKTSPGRVSVLANRLTRYGPPVLEAQDWQLIEVFKDENLRSSLTTGGIFTPIANENLTLTTSGLALVKELISLVDIVDVAT